RLPGHRRAGGGGLFEHRFVRVNEMAEILVRPERAGIDEVLELFLDLFLAQPAAVGDEAVSFGEKMRLVQRAEFVHQTLVELGVGERVAVAGDADAEKLRTLRIRLRKLVVSNKALVLS